MGGKSEKKRKRKRKGKEKRKERKKEKKEGRKGKKRREGGLMVGHGRWSPAAAGGGRRQPESGSSSPSNHGGASLAHLKNLEFCKRDFGERSNSSLERARRGEENDIVGGGQGGVGGGENGDGVLEVNGLF